MRSLAPIMGFIVFVALMWAAISTNAWVNRVQAKKAMCSELQTQLGLCDK